MDKQPGQGAAPHDGAGFAKALNRHGYPFHYRTLKAAQNASESRTSDWVFQVSDFPVEVRGRHSRIDYVLQWKQVPTFLVVECKRANPKMKRWCFARAPYIRRNGGTEYLLAETLLFNKGTGDFSATILKEWFVPDGRGFHIALEMKVKDEKGDEEGSTGRSAIEDAATQVNVGVNGLIEFFRTNPPPFSADSRMMFFPVVVTTAQLFAADVELSAADIESGEIDPATVKLTEKDWIFYQYPVSPGLKHSVPQAKPSSGVFSLVDLGKSLDATYLRSVAIVQGKHIEKFLSWFGSHLH